MWIKLREKRKFWTIVLGCLIGAVLLGVIHAERKTQNWLKKTGYRPEDYPGLENLTLQEFVEQTKLGFLDPQDVSRLILKKGEYQITKTVIIPENALLVIEQGTRLNFARGASLISYSPIQARGTKEEPIMFTPATKGKKWGVVGIVEASPSVFEYVVFEHGGQALVNDIEFAGGLTVIDAEVEISHCQFLNMTGKDAVNVQHGKVRIRHSIFKNVRKDGLDLDGCIGEVSGNYFIDCGDEGIDLGGNEDIRVFNNTILCPKGGRIGAEAELSEILKLNKLGYSDRYEN